MEKFPSDFNQSAFIQREDRKKMCDMRLDFYAVVMEASRNPITQDGIKIILARFDFPRATSVALKQFFLEEIYLLFPTIAVGLKGKEEPIPYRNFIYSRNVFLQEVEFVSLFFQK